MRDRITRLLVGTLLLLSVGCASDEPSGASPVPSTITPTTPPDLKRPGTLLSVEPLNELQGELRNIRAYRMTYRSTDATNGEDTVVSGTAFVPGQRPVTGDWPVVAIGHGSTGIEPDCAPSTSPTIGDQLGLVEQLTALGAVVTVADYQGLGAPGVHRYLDSPTAGRNLIDSVRAVRSSLPGVSVRWAAIGGSQGGGAVWSANEQVEDYAPELDLVAAAALAPVTDTTGLVDLARTDQLSLDQRDAFQWVLASLGRQDPDLDLDLYRRGTAAASWDELTACEGRPTGIIGPADLTPQTPQAAARVKSALAAWALPQSAPRAPMLVTYGGKDTYIPSDWTATAIRKACTLGAALEVVYDPEGTHGAISGSDPVKWLADRFTGKTFVDDC